MTGDLAFQLQASASIRLQGLPPQTDPDYSLNTVLFRQGDVRDLDYQS